MADWGRLRAREPVHHAHKLPRATPPHAVKREIEKSSSRVLQMSVLDANFWNLGMVCGAGIAGPFLLQARNAF